MARTKWKSAIPRPTWWREKSPDLDVPPISVGCFWKPRLVLGVNFADASVPAHCMHRAYLLASGAGHMCWQLWLDLHVSTELTVAASLSSFLSVHQERAGRDPDGTLLLLCAHVQAPCLPTCIILHPPAAIIRGWHARAPSEWSGNLAPEFSLC